MTEAGQGLPVGTRAEAGDRRVIFYLAPNPWQGPWQRTQHLATGLAKTWPTVFVEPAAYSLPGVLRRRLAGGSRRSWRSGLRSVTPSLSVFTPAATVPGSLQARSLNRLVHHLAVLGLHRCLPPAYLDAPTVILGWPPALDLATRVPGARLIYDCLDLFPAFPGRRRSRLLAALEAEIEAVAAAVVVTSRRLERLWGPRHRRVVRIANGVDPELFMPGGGPSAGPPDLASLPRPRLGYVGTLGPWVDLELLTHLAARRPNASIVVVGPVEPGVRRPRGLLNLHLLGERPYAMVPAYLAALDVLLIPFRLSELTQAVNPVKLYEYCASGGPIAATPIEEVLATDGLCHIGEGPHGFLAAVDSALAEATRPEAGRSAARHAFARRNTWEHRVSALASLLENLQGDRESSSGFPSSDASRPTGAG